jgi:hypothetical protein
MTTEMQYGSYSCEEPPSFDNSHSSHLLCRRPSYNLLEFGTLLQASRPLETSILAAIQVNLRLW